MIDNNNWTPWNGLPFLPVPDEAVVTVKLRSGNTMSGKAKNLLWGRAKREVAANDNDRNGGEIVAYQLKGEAA